LRGATALTVAAASASVVGACSGSLPASAASPGAVATPVIRAVAAAWPRRAGPARPGNVQDKPDAAAARPSARYCRAGGARLWANLAACGWPGPANTGPNLSQCPGRRLVPRGTSLRRVIEVRTANAVISCQKILGVLDIEARNVTVRNTSIMSSSGKKGVAANGTADIFVADGASATIDHVTINGDDAVHACIWHQGTKLTVTAVNCFGVNDGIFSWADTGYSATTGDHFTIKDSYFHGFTTATANGHGDGYQTEGARNGLIEHNTYRMTTAADSAIAIWDSLKTSRNITVIANLITGGGFAVYADDYSPGDGAPGHPPQVGGFSVINIRFIDNAFSTLASGCVGKWGVWFARPAWKPYRGGPTDGWHRRGNRVLETGEHIDTHNPHRNGTLCRLPGSRAAGGSVAHPPSTC
jgi:hypothetical protein